MEYRRALYITDFCLTPCQNVPNCGILCQGDKTLAVGGASAFTDEPDLEVFHLRGMYATPGFIDLHIHGAGGFDSSTAHEEGVSIDQMCLTLASHGVTSFMPTIISSARTQMPASISAIAEMIDKPHPGAEPVGIHVEGPFLNQEKHGSQRIEDLIDIDLGFARELIAAGNGKIKVMTFAPELPGAIELIELMLASGIKPSMGHSLADEAHVLKAVDAGATRCTHLYNGMPPLHQRDVALTAVALTDDRITIELILDGSFLHPRMVDLACRAKPKGKLIGISDAVQGAGLNDGRYHLGSSAIDVREGRVTNQDGVLAGTTLTLEKGWHNLITCTHMKSTDAAACFSLNPAFDIGLADVGEIRPGKRADISFFDTATNKTSLTICRGQIVYAADARFKERVVSVQ